MKWVEPKVQMMLYEPNNAQQFGTACTNHKLCVVSVKDGPHAKAELEVLKKAAGKRRTVPFAVVDASAKSFSLRKKLPTTGGPHVVLLRGGGKKANVSAALIKEEFGVNTITESIDAAVTNVTDFSVLKKRPVLSTRRPKNKYKSKKQAQQQNVKQRSSGQGAQKRSNRKKKTSQGGGKPATAKTTETDKGEGLVSDEERERRRQMDDEVRSVAVTFPPLLRRFLWLELTAHASTLSSEMLTAPYDRWRECLSPLRKVRWSRAMSPRKSTRITTK